MAHFPFSHFIPVPIRHGHLPELTSASHDKHLVVTLFMTGFYRNQRPGRTLPKHTVIFYDW
jgi:hypothetical protein